MIFVGVDWAEAHHDICVMNDAGVVLAESRIPEGVRGVAQLYELLAGPAGEPAEVVVGIETDRGLLVQALVAAAFEVFAINPLAASRYRERHSVSGAKSDAGDAKVLADLVRTDRHNHRPLAGDSDAVEGSDQGASSRPSERRVGPAAAPQRAPFGVARVLSRSPNRVR